MWLLIPVALYLGYLPKRLHILLKIMMVSLLNVFPLHLFLGNIKICSRVTDWGNIDMNFKFVVKVFLFFFFFWGLIYIMCHLIFQAKPPVSQNWDSVNIGLELEHYFIMLFNWINKSSVVVKHMWSQRQYFPLYRVICFYYIFMFCGRF